MITVDSVSGQEKERHDKEGPVKSRPPKTNTLTRLNKLDQTPAGFCPFLSFPIPFYPTLFNPILSNEVTNSWRGLPPNEKPCVRSRLKNVSRLQTPDRPISRRLYIWWFALSWNATMTYLSKPAAQTGPHPRNRADGPSLLRMPMIACGYEMS